jgi:hypothetical protein
MQSQVLPIPADALEIIKWSGFDIGRLTLTLSLTRGSPPDRAPYLISPNSIPSSKLKKSKDSAEQFFNLDYVIPTFGG